MSSSKLLATEDVSPIFAALGDVTRLELVQRLALGEPRSIAQLSSGLGISHQVVTKHLKVLESVGLAQATRVGRERRYACVPAGLAVAQDYLAEVARQWDAALSRLQDMVEG